MRDNCRKVSPLDLKYQDDVRNNYKAKSIIRTREVTPSSFIRDGRRRVTRNKLHSSGQTRYEALTGLDLHLKRGPEL